MKKTLLTAGIILAACLLHSAPKPQIILFRPPLETAVIKTSAVIRT